MSRYTIRDEIQSLDPERDHQRIVYLLSAYEFPFDLTRSLEFALFRTFASASISGILARTGEFTERAQKRYDDTDIIISEFTEHGYDSERGRAAIRRMNQIHGRFEIANEDFLFVLSTFVFEPIRWMARFAWRPMTRGEQLAQYHFWREIGRRMAIRDIPSTIEAFETFNQAYEEANFRYADSNRAVAAAVRDLFLSWLLPRSLWKLGEPAVHSLMDERLLAACGFPAPSPAMRRTVEGALRLRARTIRRLPARRKPRLRTELVQPSYPKGYRIEDLGPLA
jgi:hypothetical protein